MPSPSAAVNLHWLPVFNGLQPMPGLPHPNLPNKDLRILRSRSLTVPLVVLCSREGGGGTCRRRRPPMMPAPKVVIYSFFGIRSSYYPPPPLPRSLYNCIYPNNLPTNGRVVLRLPDVLSRRLTWTVTAGLFISSCPLCCSPPPLDPSPPPPHHHPSPLTP